MEPEQENQSCPLLTFDIFKKGLEGSNLTDEQMKVIFDGLKTEEREKKMNGGGRKKKQVGGVKCDVLHSIYRYSFLIAGVSGGMYFLGSQYVTCMYNPDTVELAKYLKFVLTDMFNARHFGHAYDLLGKISALGLGTLDKFTNFIKECLTGKKDERCTMNWVKNIFEIFCQVESGEVKLEDAKNQLTGVVAVEAIKNEDKYENMPQASAEGVVAYDGKKEVSIVVGDAIVTIRPNNIPIAEVVPAEEVPDEVEDDYEDFKDSNTIPDLGGRRRRTNRRKKSTKRKGRSRRRRT
jgi:hypothetical protein